MLHCPYFVRYGDLRACVVLPAANMTVVNQYIVILIFTVDKSDHNLQGHLSKS